MSRVDSQTKSATKLDKPAKLISIAAAAKGLGVHPNTICSFIAEKKTPASAPPLNTVRGRGGSGQSACHLKRMDKAESKERIQQYAKEHRKVLWIVEGETVDDDEPVAEEAGVDLTRCSMTRTNRPTHNNLSKWPHRR